MNIMERDWPSTWPPKLDNFHVFDPNGDVLLQVISRPVAKAPEPAEEEPEVVEEKPETPEAVEEEPDAVEEETAAMLDIPTPRSDEPDHSEPSVFDPRPTIEIWPGRPSPPLSPDNKEKEAPIKEWPALPNRSTSKSGGSDVPHFAARIPDLQMLVSSRHLVLASEMFCKTLGPDYKEGTRLRSEGTVNLIVENFDAEGLFILMNIVHGHARRVPRTISLEMLTEIALLVDYYKMHDVVVLYSEMWISHLEKKDYPKTYRYDARRAVIYWLLISFVFRKRGHFKVMSQIMQLGCDETLRYDIEDHIPIPDAIIETITKRRIVAIQGILKAVYDLVPLYIEKDIVCTQTNNNMNDEDRSACDAILLGSLLKSFKRIGIWPELESPFRALSFEFLKSKLDDMVIRDECELRREPHYYGYSGGHGVKSKVKATNKSLEDTLCGLDLDDFSPSTRKTRKITLLGIEPETELEAGPVEDWYAFGKDKKDKKDKRDRKKGKGRRKEKVDQGGT